MDSGAPFVLEPFQLAIAEDLFAGFAELWVVVPEANGKTTFMAAVALYHGDHVPSAEVPIAASTREQAELLYRQAAGFIHRTRALRLRFRAYDGYRRIKTLRTSGRIQVYAADAGAADGVIPTLALVDEPHRARNLDLYRVWRGKLPKRDGQLVAISTAGEPGHEFEEARARMHRSATSKRGTRCFTRSEGPDFVIHDYAVPRELAEDMDAVAEANPRAELTAEELRRKREAPTMTMEHWLRFVCNVATRADASAITPEEWDRLRDDDPIAPVAVYGFLDLGWRVDTTAMGVVLWESPRRRVVSDVRVIEPPVDEADVVRGLLELQARYPTMRGVVYDPNAGGQQMAQQLEQGLHWLQPQGVEPMVFIEHAQDNAPMVVAAARFEEAVRTGVLRWAPAGMWEALRRHVLNAAKKRIGPEKWRYDRPPDAHGRRRELYPIDALTGVLMAHSVAVGETGAPAPTPFAIVC